MRLKRLTISGFKSFPKRTSITFSLGISAIVGPNGSGKSNIVDAIRWVLGEQNPRLLRAKAMEDLIYRGNGKKGPASAYVRLVLENNSGMAPPELESMAEIEIERTLFPNGDARFRLNRKNCRLKDIRYLFLDTGAGARAYSIIDQGQVGKFVSMSPEERRTIVEEVAGISRYKARRTEASGRMRQTLQNLERLRDIIAEVEKQARSLKRQAFRANRYLELRQEEEGLSLFILQCRWDQVCSKEARLREVQAAQKKEKEGLEMRLSAEDTWLKETDLLMEENRQEVRALKQEVEGIESEIEELSLRLMDREKQLALCRQTQKSLKDKLEDINGQKRRSTKRLKEQRSTLTALKERVFRKEKEIKRLVDIKKKREEAFGALQKRLEEARDEMVDISAKSSALRSEMASLQDRQAGLRNKLSRIEKQKEAWEEELLELKQEGDRLDAIIAEKKRLIDDEDKALSRLEAKRQEVQNSIKGLKKRQNLLIPEITALKAELHTLLKFQTGKDKLPEDLKRLLSAFCSDARPLSDLIEVEKGWENIVEIALGESLHAFFINGPTRLAQLVQAIRSRSQEGMALLTWEPASDSVGHWGMEPRNIRLPGLHPLSEKITGENSASEAAKVILSYWYFVDSVDKWLGLKRDGKGLGQCCFIVSGDGFIITPWGEIRFKGEVKKKDGMLWTRARIGEISPEISEREEELKGLKIRIDQLEKEESRLLSQISQAEKRIGKLGNKADRLLAEKGNIEAKIDRIKDRLDIQTFEKDEVLRELNEIAKGISSLEDRIKSLEKQEKKAAEKLNGIENAFSQARQDRAETVGLLQGISVEMARLDTQIRAVQEEIERIEGGVKRSKTLLEDIQGELQILSERERGMVEEIEKSAWKKQGLVDKEALLLKELKEKEEGLDRLLAKRAEREGIKRQLLMQLSKASSGLHDTEIELSRLLKEKEHLAEACKTGFRKDIRETVDLPSFVKGLSLDKAEQELTSVKEKIERIGPVNLTAIEEFEEIEKRRSFLMSQEEDLRTSIEDIKKAIDRIDRQCRRKFRQALEEINKSLERVFPLLFDGGSARLSLDNPAKILESGVEFFIEIPGKRIKNLNLLSGGEKALSALALIFAIFFIKPSPFCLLDEVDAPLDQANTVRFNRLIKKIAARSQVILVTHSQRVMETADRLYGVTMEEKGVSKLVTVSLR